MRRSRRASGRFSPCVTKRCDAWLAAPRGRRAADPPRPAQSWRGRDRGARRRGPVNGSGTVIDADRGLVLTSARTVWGATSLQALDRARHPARPDRRPRAVRRARAGRGAAAHPGARLARRQRERTPGPGALVTAYGRRVTRGTRGLLTLPARVAARRSSSTRCSSPRPPAARCSTRGPARGDRHARRHHDPVGSGQHSARRVGARPAAGIRRLAGPVRVRRAPEPGHSRRAPRFKPEDARLVVEFPPRAFRDPRRSMPDEPAAPAAGGPRRSEQAPGGGQRTSPAVRCPSRPVRRAVGDPPFMGKSIHARRARTTPVSRP